MRNYCKLSLRKCSYNKKKNHKKGNFDFDFSTKNIAI